MHTFAILCLFLLPAYAEPVLGELEREYLDEDTFVYVLPPGEEYPEDVELVGTLWRYDGQATFTDSPKPRGPVTKSGLDVPAPMTRRENILESVRVDRFGRRWIPAGFDEELLAMKLAAYAEFSGGVDERGDSLALSAIAEEEEVMASDELSEEQDLSCSAYPPWTCTTCESGGDDDMFVFGSESRTHATAMTAREAKTVYLSFTAEGERTYVCSGVLIDDYTVLTAAHCLFDNDNDFFNFVAGASGGRVGAVCTKENGQTGALCTTIDSVTYPGGYTPIADPVEYDYALVYLDSNIGSGNWMPISSATDAIIEANTQYTVGTPAHFPTNCLNNDFTVGAVDSGYWRRYAYRQSANIVYSPTGWYGSTLDATAGESGAGIWHFPDGTTTHAVTMVLSRFKKAGTLAYIAGPKASSFRAWAVNFSN